MSYNQIELGMRIRELRIRMRLSQFALAEQLGVNREHITKIESGKKNPSLDLLIDVAKIYNVSLDYLIWGHRDTSVLRMRLETIANELNELIRTL